MRTSGFSESDSKVKILEAKLASFAEDIRFSLKNEINEELLKVLLEKIISFIGESALIHLYPQYAQGEYFNDVQTACASSLNNYYKNHSEWLKAIDELEGNNSIPIMTVHKSKGLEYHTILFVGLEDSALWGFAKSPTEEMCGFYVAFSRAIKRAIFTFSEKRPRRPGGFSENQRRINISSLYDLLEKAGVMVERIH